jgi:hypothetical protein
VGGGRVGFGGVDGHGEAGFGSKVEAFVGKGELTDDVVVEVFDAGAVGADVVGTPATAELVAARGQLADQVVEALVVRVLPRRRAEVGDRGVGGEPPVGVEPVGGLPRVFRTVEFVLFHAASCSFKYSMRTSCGVR